MNATDTRPSPQQTEHRSAYRVFRTALAIALGILTALVIAGALFYLVFGSGGGVVLESDGVVDEDVASLSSSQAATLRQ